MIEAPAAMSRARRAMLTALFRRISAYCISLEQA